MKSLMQEASSVLKAIEKAWENAGKPKEFSVKIFEEPKKNFIGMTVQSAKIGIFFEDKDKTALKHSEKEEIKKREQFTAKQVKPAYQKPQTEHLSSLEKSKLQKPERIVKEPFRKEKTVETQPPQEQKQKKEMWTADMIQMVHNWLTTMLKNLNRSDISFSLQPSAYQLTVQFNNAINQSPEKDQQLMRSFALILMQTLRHHFKRPLRGFKMILSTKK